MCKQGTHFSPQEVSKRLPPVITLTFRGYRVIRPWLVNNCLADLSSLGSNLTASPHIFPCFWGTLSSLGCSSPPWSWQIGQGACQPSWSLLSALDTNNSLWECGTFLYITYIKQKASEALIWSFRLPSPTTFWLSFIKYPCKCTYFRHLSEANKTSCMNLQRGRFFADSAL